MEPSWLPGWGRLGNLSLLAVSWMERGWKTRKRLQLASGASLPASQGQAPLRMRRQGEMLTSNWEGDHFHFELCLLQLSLECSVRGLKMSVPCTSRLGCASWRDEVRVCPALCTVRFQSLPPHHLSPQPSLLATSGGCRTQSSIGMRSALPLDEVFQQG